MPTRMITDATPMMIPSMVRKERILLPQILFNAILNDCSILFHIPVEIDLSVMDPHHPFCLQSDRAVVRDHDDRVSFFIEFL